MRTRLAVQIRLRRGDESRRWEAPAWHAVAVMPVAAAPDSGEARLTIELHRKDTEGYRTNLAGTPSVYVVLRADREGELSQPFLATVCPFEAQDYADDADSQVDAVPMPDSVAAWLTAFVRRHHVDEPFRKRRRQPRPSSEAFARPPGIRR